MKKLSKRQEHLTFVFLALLVVLVIAVLVALARSNGQTKNSNQTSTITTSTIKSYQQCVDAGYPVQASYPSVCRVPGGQSFTNPNEKVNPPASPQAGTWCPPPGRYSACFQGYSTDAHPAGYTFTPD